MRRESCGVCGREEGGVSRAGGAGVSGGPKEAGDSPGTEYGNPRSFTMFR